MAPLIFKDIMCAFVNTSEVISSININFCENRRNEHKISQGGELFDYDLFTVKQFIYEARL